MVTTEYKRISEIISGEYQVPNGNKLEEIKGDVKKPFSVDLRTNDEITYTLFRLDPDEKNFLPFFRNSGETPKPYQGLRYFCDYILLVGYNKNTFILLIEIKRGKGDEKHAEHQLNASQTFVEYIRNTAMRLNDDKNLEYNDKNVRIYKILLKPSKTPKEATKPKDIDLTQEIIKVFEYNTFRIVRFLK